MTGYQLHVRTFTLHTVLKTVADSYTPPDPPSVDIRPASTPEATDSTAVSSSGGGDGGSRDSASTSAETGAAMAMAVEGEDGQVADEDAPAARVAVAPAIPSSLVRPAFDACIPGIVELLMEDLFGETAAAKEVRALGAFNKIASWGEGIVPHHFCDVLQAM